MGEKLKKLLPVIVLVPLAAGSIGYRISGEQVTNSLYAGFALYFTNPVSEAYNCWIEFARWTAPAVTMTAVLCALGSFWHRVIWWIQCRAKDSVAVYCDEGFRISFGVGTMPIYPGRAFKKGAKTQMIFFPSDAESLAFYEEHKEGLGKKPVYIGLRELDQGLLRETEHVTFFDINGSVARTLWKRICVWKRNCDVLQITILGDGALAKSILDYGLLLNLYSKGQHISYHLIGSGGFYQARHPELHKCLGNMDEILYHNMEDAEIWAVISKSDLVIIADTLSADMIQAVCVNAGEGELYYYAPDGGGTASYLLTGDGKLYGRDQDIFTDENIRLGKLIESAKRLNLEYAMKYGGEKDWNRLSGFLKWSNISSADFGDVLRFLIPAGSDQEELAELEHIRWCRFHYLNNWKQGKTENGKNRDDAKKIHGSLKAYGELSEEEKDKDRAVIAAILYKKA